MAVRGKRTTAKKTPTATVSRDVTQYADKVPTGFQKCFARWATEQVGYQPTNRKDFLMGISIATAARNIFQQSEFLANWREETGEAKRGPKPKNAQSQPTTAAKGRKAKPAPEPEPEESEENDWTEEDVEEREDELNEMTVAALKKVARTECEATAADLKELPKKADLVGFILDYEFPEDDEEEEEGDDDEDDSEEDDEDEDEDDEEDEDDDDEEEEVEEAPKARRGARSSGRSTGKTTPARQGKAASGAKAKSGKDDYLF